MYLHATSTSLGSGAYCTRNRRHLPERTLAQVTGRADRGAALIMTMMVTSLLSALGLALAMLSTVDTWLSAGLRTSQELSHAADVAVARVQVDLCASDDWTGVLAAAVTNPPSTFNDGLSIPTLADGTTVNLAAQTQLLQADSDTRFGSSAVNGDSPEWRLFAHAPLVDLIPGRVGFSSIYLAAWIADDPGDGDADAGTDTNGRLMIRGTAFAPGGARRSVEAVVARVGPSGSGTPVPATRMLSWKEVR